jgi:uncharacterized protein YggT (Ycf19 family)
MLLAALTRLDVAQYVSAVFTVYIICVFAWVLLQVLFSFGARPPYARWSEAIMNFLTQVSEPYIRIFRRFIPPLGPLDLSPMLAIIVLYVAQNVLFSAISGT